MTPAELRAQADGMQWAHDRQGCGVPARIAELRAQAAATPQPEPVADWYYEFDTAFGLLRSFSPAPWNGMPPSRSVRIYTVPPDQSARIKAERDALLGDAERWRQLCKYMKESSVRGLLSVLDAARNMT